MRVSRARDQRVFKAVLFVGKLKDARFTPFHFRSQVGYKPRKLTFYLKFLSNFSFVHSQHFFGPPAIGFGAGLISVHRSLPLATSIGNPDFINVFKSNLTHINN